MTAPITHYFFVQSPWSFFGLRRLVDIAKRHGVTIDHKPVQASEIWKHGGGVPLKQRPLPRQQYRTVEMKRWRDYLDMPVHLEPKFFPVDESLAARTIIAAQLDGQNVDDLIETLMGDIWLRERNAADPETIAGALKTSGLSEDYLARADGEDVTRRYAENTEAAKNDNIFGVPTYFVDGEMFWGQDRLDFIDRKLAKLASQA